MHNEAHRRASSPRRTFLFGSLAILCGWAATVRAEDPARHYAVPAQPLGAALTAFADLADLKLLFPAELARGLASPGVAGTLTRDQALAGTGMIYRFTSPDTVTLERPDPPSELAVEAKKLLRIAESEAAPAAPKKTGPDQPTVLEEMTVTAAPLPLNRNYVPTPTAGATKTDTPIFDSPVSVQVVPEQVFKDQRATTIKDALENVSGVRSFNNEAFGYVYNIRGFKSFDLYRNSLLSSLAVATVYDTASLEKVEVMKGPASILFGRAQPGGVINMVTKRPLEISYYSLEQEFGSYDHYRTVWDATGPLTVDHSLLYRVDGAYQDSGSFRDFHGQERVLIPPSLIWRPTGSTEAKIEVEHFHHDVQNDIGIPAIGDGPASIPVSRSFQEPDDPVDETYRTTVGFELTHAFNDSWRIHNRFHYIDAFFEQVDVESVAIRPDNRTLDRAISGQQLDTGGIYATNLDLIGNVDLFGSRHDVLVGLDYYYEYYDYLATGGHAGFDETDPALIIDIFDPRYAGLSSSQIRAVFDQQLAARRLIVGPSETEHYGVYFQDHITLFDKLHILGGGRYDWGTVASGCCPLSDAEAQALLDANQNEDDEFSPQVGILYQPWPTLGIYGSWSNSFGFNNGVSASGDPQPPESGEQWEAGIKTELYEQRLNATLAFYHLTKENILTDDLSTPALFDTIAVGEARSRGVELDIFGQITDEISFIGSYAYTDAEVTKDNAGLEGNDLDNVAEHSGSASLVYEFKHHDLLNGLRLGFGVFAVGERQGDIENTFTLPGYVRLDAFGGYTYKLGQSRISAQLNIRNLNDKSYFEGDDTFFSVPARLGIFPGAPLTVIGTLRVEF